MCEVHDVERVIGTFLLSSADNTSDRVQNQIQNMFWCNIATTKITQTSKRMHMSGTVTCTRMAVSRFESNFILSYPAELRDPPPLWHTPFWACSCWQSLLVPEVHSRIASCPREPSGCGCGVVFRDRICSDQLTPF